MGLFGGGGGNDGGDDRPPLPSVAPFDDLERLAEERAAVGFYLSGHPLDDYQKRLAQKGITRIENLPDAFARQKSNIGLAGTISAVQIRRNAKGNSYAFVGLSDPSGECECLCFSEVLNRFRDEMEAGRNVVIYADIMRDREEPTLVMTDLRDLDGFVADAEAGARIVLSGETALQPIRAVLDRAGPGRGLIRLVIRPGGDPREIEIDPAETFRIDRALRQSLKSMPGVIDVAEI